MCGACGVLAGGPDWTDRVGNPGGIGHDERLTRGAERQHRVRLVNMMLKPGGARLIDCGSLMVLRGATGRTEVVDSLAHVWTAMDRVGPRSVDPLDEDFLTRLAGP